MISSEIIEEMLGDLRRYMEAAFEDFGEEDFNRVVAAGCRFGAGSSRHGTY